MTNEAHIPFWTTAAQIAAVLGLALAIEVRHLSRNSAKATKKRHPIWWMSLSILYVAAGISLILVLIISLEKLASVDSLLRLAPESEADSTRNTVMFLSYGAAVTILVPLFNFMVAFSNAAIVPALNKRALASRDRSVAKQLEYANAFRRQAVNLRLEVRCDLADSLISQSIIHRTPAHNADDRKMAQEILKSSEKNIKICNEYIEKLNKTIEAIDTKRSSYPNIIDEALLDFTKNYEQRVTNRLKLV